MNQLLKFFPKRSMDLTPQLVLDLEHIALCLILACLTNSALQSLRTGTSGDSGFSGYALGLGRGKKVVLIRCRGNYSCTLLLAQPLLALCRNPILYQNLGLGEV